MFRLAFAPQFNQNLRHVVRSHDVIGIIFQQEGIHVDGFIITLRFGIERSQVKIGRGILRIDFNDLPIGSDGIFIVLHVDVEIPEDEMDIRVIGIVDKGFFAEIDGPSEVTLFNIERSQFLHEVRGKGIMPERGFQFLNSVIQSPIQGGENPQGIVIAGGVG
ncbi:MAG: hypothetical protein A4E74_01727 [Syntrophus sp. PtaB.Bin075]|nr:MAG: hypothetical protein A4E74_01727 [Syntrophus sp. PtaB.Bin075]